MLCEGALVDPSYDKVLSSIESRLPDLHRTLYASHTARVHRLSQYAEGTRLSGADELLRHLRLIEKSLAEHGHENALGFLVARSTADFEIAVDAALSGMLCLAHDAMRDVMELEFLLRDFIAEPDHLDRWLSADQDEVKNFFSPNCLRQREA